MKLLVTDIDSTLSVGEFVTDEAAAACGELRRNGWRIMIATGRTLNSCLHHIGRAGAEDAAILYDGARVMSARTGREIMGFELSRGDALEILKFSWDYGVEIQLTGDELVYCRESDVTTLNFCKGAGIKCSFMDRPEVRGKVYRIAFWGERDVINSFEAGLRGEFRDRFCVVRCGYNFIDLLPRGVSKGYALDEVIRGGHIGKPDILAAAGDHMNDFELLSRADISIAPRDGAPEILEIADVVMPPVAEHGFTYLAKTLCENT